MVGNDQLYCTRWIGPGRFGEATISMLRLSVRRVGAIRSSRSFQCATKAGSSGVTVGVGSELGVCDRRGWLGAQSEWEEWYGVGGCAGGAGDSKERIRPKSRGGMNEIVGGELTDALQHQADNNPVARHAAEAEGGVEGVEAVWGERSWGTGSLISASPHRCQPMEIGTISQRRASRLPIARRPSPPPATASDHHKHGQREKTIVARPPSCE